MDIQYPVSVRSNHFGRDLFHVAGQDNGIDSVFFQRSQYGVDKFIPGWERGFVDHSGGDSGGSGDIQCTGIRIVGDEEGDSSMQSAFVDGFQDRLKIRSSS